MGAVANIYDNGPISLVAKIKENLAVWTNNEWKGFNIEHAEPVPRSNPFIVEMITAANGTVIAAYGTLQKQLVGVLLMNTNELLHLRWEPLDDVEGRLWELAEAARNSPRGGHARVSMMTSARDPYLASTTFFIMGANRDVQIEVLNPNPIAVSMARFAFWGYRYIVKPLETIPSNATYLPAQALIGVR